MLPKDIVFLLIKQYNVTAIDIINLLVAFNKDDLFKHFKYVTDHYCFDSGHVQKFNDRQKNYVKRIRFVEFSIQLHGFNNLNSIEFSNYFGIAFPLFKGFFPESLKIIKFNDKFNNAGQELEKDIFPKGMTVIKFGKDFINGGKKLKKDVFPFGLKSLSFSFLFPKELIVFEELPKTIESLTFDAGYNPIFI